MRWPEAPLVIELRAVAADGSGGQAANSIVMLLVEEGLAERGELRALADQIGLLLDG
jgi:hypothetical protein